MIMKILHAEVFLMERSITRKENHPVNAKAKSSNNGQRFERTKHQARKKSKMAWLFQKQFQNEWPKGSSKCKQWHVNLKSDERSNGYNDWNDQVHLMWYCLREMKSFEKNLLKG